MSRIGKAPITIPSGVTIDVSKSNLVTVKGAKGELKQQIDQDLEVAIEEGVLTVKRPTDQKRHRAMHGLYRSLINNMVVGVSDGYTELTLGFSHPIYFYVADEVKLNTTMEKGQPPKVILESADKQLIGQIAAKIRAFRSPEPYKGKGIRFAGEEIRRKQGKTAG